MSRYVGAVALIVASLTAGNPAFATPVAAIQRVVVHSNQARVFREARVTVGGEGARLTLANLPAAVVPGTVQVECPTARIQRVELVRSGRRLPRQKLANDLAKELERRLGARRVLVAERHILRTEVSYVRALALQSSPPRAGGSPAPGISVGAWRSVLGWQEARLATAHRRLAELAAQRVLVDRKIHQLQVKARDLGLLQGGARGTAVVVTVAGRAGQHRLVLSYLVNNVRWVPAYDLRYDPGRGRIQASYHAVVRQHSGEDWKGARLAFSTGRPSRLHPVPRLGMWTIGRQRDFSPEPRTVLEPPQKVWRPGPAVRSASAEVQRLRRAMAMAGARARVARQLEEVERGHREIEQKAKKREAEALAEVTAEGKDTRYPPLKIRVQRAQLRHYTAKLRTIVVQVTALMRQARQAKDIIKLNCVNDKLIQLMAYARVAASQLHRFKAAAARADRPGASRIFTLVTVAYQKGVVLEQEANSCIGEDIAYVGATRVETEVNPVMAGGHGVRVSRPPPVVRRLPWIDAVYEPPAVDRDSPEGAARGYLFTLRAPGRHTVPSSGKSQRVPLLRVILAARPVHRLLPALSRSAYVVATLRNTTGRPILRGHANLFSGAAFVGRSWLNTALPGHDLRLPLGVDDGVKVARNMRQKTVQQGVLFKDDVTRYTVELEVANHHRRAISVQLLDQVPLARGKKVKVKEVRFHTSGRPQKPGPPGKGIRPGWTAPNKQGRVSWSGEVGPSSVKKLSFSFTIVRPKGMVLEQSRGGAR